MLTIVLFKLKVDNVIFGSYFDTTEELVRWLEDTNIYDDCDIVEVITLSPTLLERYPGDDNFQKETFHAAATGNIFDHNIWLMANDTWLEQGELKHDYVSS